MISCHMTSSEHAAGGLYTSHRPTLSLSMQTTAVDTVRYFRMLQRMLFAACFLLVVESFDTDVKYIHKKTSVVQPPQPPGACDGDRVKCPNSDRCLPSRWFCDGENDCGDASDEEDCPPRTCSSDQTKCPTKNLCRPSYVFCDGNDDCGDNSDEPEDCLTRTCPEGQLKCNSGQCIDSSGYCTGSLGCRDNTQFPDICPDVTCDPGYVKCPRKSWCIRSNYFCDTDNDCGDLGDEPADCSERSCEPGEFKCGSGQCLNRTALCLSSIIYGCRDKTDITNLCSDFTCPTGYFKCVSDGKCTANSNLCDGTAHCNDSSDESLNNCDLTIKCAFREARCPSVRHCIHTRYFCDTENDCPDKSDENEVFCSTRTCQPTEVRCRNGQCIDKDFFCNRDYTCRDGSLRDKSDICPNQGSAQLEPHFNPYSTSGRRPSAEERSCFMALTQMHETCSSTLSTLYVELGAGSHKAARDKIVAMDLSDLCRPAQGVLECFRSVLSPCVGVDNPMLDDVKQLLSVAERMLEYVCIQQIEVFNRNKACLLELDESDPDSPKLTLFETLGTSCGELWTPPRRERDIFCSVSDDFHGCAKNVVAAQCGDEVAGALNGLANLVTETAGCNNALQSRSLRNPHKHNRVRQLGSSDEEEFQCMMALVSVGETCGENPFKNSEFDSNNPRVIYDQVVESDLRKLCSIIQPWYECIQQAFSSCANVNNPMIAEMKRMLPLMGTSLDYVCVEHVDVFNSGKACLLREASSGPRGPYPTPVIAQSVVESCARYIQPATGDPICTQQVSLEACVTEIIANQCGSTLANTLSGLNDAIRSAAGCPARRAVIRALPAALKKRRGFSIYKRT